MQTMQTMVNQTMTQHHKMVILRLLIGDEDRHKIEIQEANRPGLSTLAT
jgi:hypothetical protein